MTEPLIDMNRVTVGQFIEFCQLLEKLQPEFDKRFGDRTDLSNAEILTQYPEYVEAIVKFWTGWETTKDKDADLVLGIFVAIEQFSNMPEPEPLKAFEHEGEWYHAPQDVKLLKKTAPMAKATFGQALEALQMEQLIEGKYEMIPYVLATIFLREGETVEDINVNERGELFHDIPITTAMNAYFFLAHFANTWLPHFSRSSKVAAPETEKQPRPA